LAGIGILGGTFNPPHLGHLAVARAARRELDLGRVLLMPVHTPPHKAPGADPGPAHRLAMCRLLAEAEPRVEASDLEIARGGPSYTADTLASIHDSDPDAELTFIVGADTARTLPSWHDPAKVLRLARIAVAARSGSEREQVCAAIAAAAGEGGQASGEPAVSFLRMGSIDISSSAARERARRGEPLEDVLGPAVAAYVSDHGLYRDLGRGEG
jgi:nicotinate-nucleotide adenylyltransferase